MGNSISGTRTPFRSWGRTIQLSADGAPKHVTAGITLNWDSIPAVAGAAIQYEDAVRVEIGEKAVRYGTILTRDADGRWSLATEATVAAAAPGEVVAVNETVKEGDINSNHPPCIVGGKIFRDRLLVNGAGQPTLATVASKIGFTYAFN